jgi:hypothetical protein
MSKKGRKEVDKILAKWRPRLFLGEWSIDVQFPEEGPDGGVGYDIVAECYPDPVYMIATIKVHKAWFKHPPKAREFAIAHELVHCHTQELWNIADRQANGYAIPRQMVTEAVERLTQRITNIAFDREWNP